MLRRLQRVMEQIMLFSATAGKTVNAITRIIGVQRDNTIKLLATEFCLQQLHLWLCRILPELTV